MNSIQRIPGHEGQRAKGFTVLELLVASALTVTIAAVVLGLVGTTLEHWHRLQGHLIAQSRARRVLDQLALDLQSAVVRDGAEAWLRVTVQREPQVSAEWVGGGKPVDASFDPAAAFLTDARFGVAGCWLRFITTRVGRELKSGAAAAPVAVGYQIVRRAPTPSSAECRYQLYRTEVTSAATFAAGYDLNSAAYLAPSSIDGAPGNLPRPLARQVLAENVIDFGVRLYGYAPASPTGASRLIQIFPDGAESAGFPGESPSTDDGAAPRLRVVDVMIRILTDDGARRMAVLEGGNARGDWWATAAAHSFVFTQRMVIQGGGI